MLLSYMSQSSRGSFFDQQLDSYRNRLSAIKQEEALNWAKKIAESEQPIEALKQAVAEIATPLALDFLREGIMHYAGVASARIGNKLKGLDPKFQEIFKGRMDELVKLKDMTPEQRKKWIADEVKSRRDARLAAAKEKADSLRQEAGDAANRVANQARKAARGGAEREEDGSGGGREQAQPANSGQEGATDEANERGAVGGDDRVEATRTATEQPEGNPTVEDPQSRVAYAKPDLDAVDDRGVQDRIDSFPATDNPEAEFRSIDKAINKKARRGLNKEDRSALGDKTKIQSNDDAVAGGNDSMKAKLNAKNQIINDAVGRKQQNLAPADSYNASGTPSEPTNPDDLPSLESLGVRSEDLEEQQEQPVAKKAPLRGAPEPELNLTEPTEIDAFTGQPVDRTPKAPEEPEFDEEAEDPYPETQRTVAAPPPERPKWSRVNDIPPMGQGEPIRAVPERNPISFVQAQEGATRANMARLFPKPDEGAVDFTGAAARKVDPNYSRAAQGSDKLPSTRPRPEVSDALSSAQQTAADNAPKIDIRARAQEFNSKFQIIPSKPQTGRLGQGDVPVLRAPVSAEPPVKARVPPTLPKVNATSGEVEAPSRVRAPIISEETSGRIGTGLGVLGQAGQIAAIAGGQGTATQKAQAIGEATGVTAGAEAATRVAARLGAGEAVTEGAGLLPGVIATLAGKGTAGQKAGAVGQQVGTAAAQKAAAKGVSALTKGTSAAEEAESGASTAAKAVAGAGEAEEGLGGLEAGLAASGAETGGLGFLAAGAVGLISALASIFSPHHDPDPKKAPPQPVPNLSIPVLQ